MGSLTHFTVAVREVDAVNLTGMSPIATFTTPYVIDLLAYQDGSMASLGQSAIPSQTYSQIRLVLADSSQASFDDGTTLPVHFRNDFTFGVGSRTMTGHDGAGNVDIMVTMNNNISSSDTVDIDFNALESIAALHPDRLGVLPALVALPASHAGIITGSVTNSSGAPVQNAVVVAYSQGGSVENSSSTDNNGNFNLHALRGGNYQIVIYNVYHNSAGETILASGQSSSAGSSVIGPAVSVQTGSTTSAGRSRTNYRCNLTRRRLRKPHDSFRTL